MPASSPSYPPHLTPLERGRLDGLLARLVTEPLLDRVVVFGSRARGRSGPDSDIDLAIYFRSSRSRELEHWLDEQAVQVDENGVPPRLHVVAFFAGDPPSRLDAALQR